MGDVTFIDPIWRWCHLYWPNLKVMSPLFTKYEGDITFTDQIWRWHHLCWPNLMVMSHSLTQSKVDITLIDLLWRWWHLHLSCNWIKKGGAPGRVCWVSCWVVHQLQWEHHQSCLLHHYPELKNIGLTFWVVRKTSFWFGRHVLNMNALDNNGPIWDF